MNLVACPRCGMVLPPHARFCAHCGAPQPGAAPAPSQSRRPAGWVLVLFWLGAFGLLLVGVVYGVLAAAPDVAGQEADAARVRITALVVALCAGSLFVAQLVAAIGLTGGWPWARVLATLVSVAWCLSCLGIPVAVLTLNAIWRPRQRAPAGLVAPPKL